MMTSTLSSLVDASVLFEVVTRFSGKAGMRQAAIIREFAIVLPNLLDRFEVTTALRVAHLLAQVAHESDGFATTVEYATGAAYEGRKDLGNTKPGDGKRYKGRGPIQLTGRANYRAFTAWLRAIVANAPDFEAQPELVADFPWAAWSTFYFWSTRGLNALADRDDLIAVTRKINGGTNGLTDRSAKLAKAKAAIARLSVSVVSSKQGFNALGRGDTGADVERVQRALAAAGHYLLTIDGVFGPGTEGAVKTFQRSRGLIVDGVVGEQTRVALEPFEQDKAA